MRLALLSDIHGNILALDAVLADIQARGGVDGYWLVGDLVALGPDPVGVLERVAALPNLTALRGNTDRYVSQGERPGPSLADVAANSDLLPVLVEISQSFAWTQGMVTCTGWLAWLQRLPVEQRLVLPDGTRLLAVHASPGTDDGPGIHPGASEAELAALVAQSEADLICVGHTHWPMDVRAGASRVVNLGSVSNPYPPDLRASYVLLEGDAAGYTLAHCRVAYDRQAVIRALHQVQHPSPDYIIRCLLGHRRPP